MGLPMGQFGLMFDQRLQTQAGPQEVWSCRFFKTSNFNSNIGHCSTSVFLGHLNLT